eukprot:2585117-Rhodomonas_salina.1
MKSASCLLPSCCSSRVLCAVCAGCCAAFFLSPHDTCTACPRPTHLSVRPSRRTPHNTRPHHTQHDLVPAPHHTHVCSLRASRATLGRLLFSATCESIVLFHTSAGWFAQKSATAFAASRADMPFESTAAPPAPSSFLRAAAAAT